MGVFFGTDGIRGIVNDSLTYELAFRCGNAVASSKSKPTVLIGGDTRPTGSFLTNAFSGGVMSAGGSVIDIGVCPTPGIAYISKAIGVDFGTVISASHNPA
jgi:phosphoglucosamine mutase